MIRRFAAVALLCAVAGAGWAQSTFSGAYAAKLTCEATGADLGLDRNNSPIPVTGGSAVTLSFYLKSANLGPTTNTRATIACFTGVSGTGEPTGFISDLNTAANVSVGRVWTRFTFATTLPANAAYVNVGFRITPSTNPPASMLIDSVLLAYNSAPNTNLIPNGGFDTWTGGPAAAPDGWRFFNVGGTGSIGRLEQIPAVGPVTQMTNLFKVDAGTSVVAGALPWFGSDGTDAHNTRGMTFNPHTGNLLVVDRDPVIGNNVYVLSATTGAQLGVFNTTGVTGGTFAMNKVGVDDSGRVFIANLGLNGGPFRVYMYANEATALTTAPTLVYDANTNNPGRWGDDFDVAGSGATTRLLVASRSRSEILVLEDPENDSTFAPAAQSITVDGVAGPGNVAFDTDPTRYWYHQSYTSANQMDYELLPYNLNGSPAGDPVPTSIGAYPTGPFDVAQISNKLVALGPAEAEQPTANRADIRGYVYSISGATPIAIFQTSGLERAGVWTSNGNGGGDVAFDAANKRVYFLATNNSISGWTLPPVPTAAEDWQHLQ